MNKLNNVKLNPFLVEERKISEESQLGIKAIHIVPDNVLNNPENFDDAVNIVDVIHGLEYELQKLWEFPQDSGFHKFDFEIKGCKCPLLDNYNMWVTVNPRRYYNTECLIHHSKVR